MIRENCPWWKSKETIELGLRSGPLVEDDVHDTSTYTHTGVKYRWDVCYVLCLLLQEMCAPSSSPTRSRSCSAFVWTSSVSAWQVTSAFDWLISAVTHIMAELCLMYCCSAACAIYRGIVDLTFTSARRQAETCEPHIKYGEKKI